MLGRIIVRNLSTVITKEEESKKEILKFWYITKNRLIVSNDTIYIIILYRRFKQNPPQFQIEWFQDSTQKGILIIIIILMF